jgi:hypothetical protein
MRFAVSGSAWARSVHLQRPNLSRHPRVALACRSNMRECGPVAYDDANATSNSMKQSIKQVQTDKALPSHHTTVAEENTRHDRPRCGAASQAKRMSTQATA